MHLKFDASKRKNKTLFGTNKKTFVKKALKTSGTLNFLYNSDIFVT